MVIQTKCPVTAKKNKLKMLFLVITGHFMVFVDILWSMLDILWS